MLRPCFFVASYIFVASLFFFVASLFFLLLPCFFVASLFFFCCPCFFFAAFLFNHHRVGNPEESIPRTVEFLCY